MRRKDFGQNLVELALVLPMVFILGFAIVEMGRIWHTYEVTKMAVLDGAYTASITQDAATGQKQLVSRLTVANLAFSSPSVSPVLRNTQTVGYKAGVTVTYSPIFGGTFGLIPDRFDISYSDINYYSIY